MKRHQFTWAAIAMIVAHNPVYAQNVTVYTGVQYSAGDYIFAERSDAVYANLGVGVWSERVSVGVDIPFVYQSNPYVTYGLVVPVPTGGPRSDSVRAQRGPQRPRGASGQTDLLSLRPFDGAGPTATLGTADDPIVIAEDTTAYSAFGFADPSLTVRVTIVRASERTPSVSIFGSAKPPLASVKDGFSTGAFDFTVGLSAFYLVRSTTVSSSVTYFTYGDMLELDLRIAVGLSGYVARTLRSGAFTISASGFYSTPIVDGVAAPATATGAISLGPGRTTITLIGSIGLTESSPDYAVGITLSHTL